MRIEIELKQEIDNSYQIYIEPLKKLHIDSKVAIITNTTVKKLHIDYLLQRLEAVEVKVIELEDGERYKNIQSILSILDNLFENHFNRSSKIIAFGGGVVGDMSGFAAAIFQRGIEFIQIPTTLLSQVDASVGGKTGINSKYGKNLIGAFHQPKAVYIDSHFLQTLPRREFNAGVAEMIKMAVTFDVEFFNWLESVDLTDKKSVQDAVASSVRIKASVVAKDEKEMGIRAALNYGHTFGHVVEREGNFEKFLHGEAVSIGIIMANRLSVALGKLTHKEESRIRTLLERYSLPTLYHIDDIEKFYEAFFLDKKSGDNSITFILASNIGSVEIVKDIEKSTVIDALKSYNALGAK